MNPKNRLLMLAVAATLTLQHAASAQIPSAPAGPVPVYDPAQLPAFRGEVWQYTLSPRGDIDGLILSDGTEVKTPPQLSSQIAYSLKPGHKVVIRGLKAASIPLVKAVSITDEATNVTISDSAPNEVLGPPRPGPGLESPGRLPPVGVGGLTEAADRVHMSLHGPEGEVNGALLENGTVLRLPPIEAQQFTDLLQPGRRVFAQGATYVSALGKVMEVQRIGTTRETAVDIGEPAPRPPRP